MCGHTLNLSAIKSPYYISALEKYACGKLVWMNMPCYKNALLYRYIYWFIFNWKLCRRSKNYNSLWSWSILMLNVNYNAQCKTQCIMQITILNANYNEQCKFTMKIVNCNVKNVNYLKKALVYVDIAHIQHINFKKTHQNTRY